MSDNTGEAPKIQIDSDWKSQAQREKERLAEQERKASAARGVAASTGAAAPPGAVAAGTAAGRSAARAAGAGAAPAGHEEMPPANWDTLVATLATQALMYLGGAADPRTGQPMVDLDVARHQIDLLSVLQTKTQGNLDDDESRRLAMILHDLRMRYIQIAQATVPTVAEALRGSWPREESGR